VSEEGRELDEVVRSYFGGVAPAFADGYTPASRSGYVYQRRRALVTEVLQGLGGGELLDVGCATGVFEAVARDCGYSYRGVDVSEEMISEARSAHADGDPTRFTVGRVEQLGLPSEQVDVVLALGVIEYVHPTDLDRAMAELARVLKPGGTLVLSLLNRSSPIWFARSLRSRVRARLRGARRHAYLAEAPEATFSRREVERLVDRAGLHNEQTTAYAFAIVPARVYGRHPAWWSKLSARLELLRKTPLSFLALAYLSVSTKPK
jgi:ubiquinone/menaquinone biosynthesis C-methylase UbiE